VVTPNATHGTGSAPTPEDSSRISEPAFSEDGVDLTLIRWMLSLTPLERLHVLQGAVSSIASLRNARAGT
jgi:hypothetical protein